jgi:hypothetical protein
MSVRMLTLAEPGGGFQPAERAFLPAALAIVETPPSPLGRTFTLSICGLFVAAAIWSYVGLVDIVASLRQDCCAIQNAGHAAA